MAYLGVVDYVVFVAFILISLGIGLYYALSGGKQRTVGEFLLADRQLGILPASLSIIVSFQSAIMVLGFNSEMYTRGTQYWFWGSVAFMNGVLLAERLVLRIFYPLKLTSIYDYLEIRFQSQTARYIGTLLGLTQQVLYSGIAMFAPSIAMEAVSGIPVWCSIIIMAVVCTCYTTLGGLKAVVWTDVFQFTIMLVGIIVVLIKGVLEVGGIRRVWEINEIGGRIEYVNFDPRPTQRNSIWTIGIGYSIFWFAYYGCNQASVQRFASTKSIVSARSVLFINIPLVIIMQCIVGFLGLVVYAYFSIKACDPLENGDIRNQNQLLPLFVVEVMGDIPGIPGLFVATLYSGALSSVSSSLSAASANTWDDILKRRLGRLSGKSAALITRLLVVGYGVLSTVFALIVMSFPGPMTQIANSFLGAIIGPLIGMFLVGMLTRWVNWKGVVIGGLSSLAVVMWIILGSFSVDQGILNPPMQPITTEGCRELNTSIYSNNNIGYHTISTISTSNSSVSHETDTPQTM